MRASFMYVVCYQVNASCYTPLHANQALDEVLRRENGRIFLQGSSIAGALRWWIGAEMGETMADALFGTQNKCGSLRISDAEFTKDTMPSHRPRLRIDGGTGTAADGGKFDVAYIPPEACFQFTVTWLGVEPDEAQLEAVEAALSAMNEGEIHLGGQKSNGFGEVRLQVKKASLDMRQEKDRQAWLQNCVVGRNFSLQRLPHKQKVIFSVEARVDRILIKSDAAIQRKKGSVAQNIRENGRPVLPGSAVKGAILARVRSIAALLHVPEVLLEEALGRGAQQGDSGIAGKVYFEDVYLEGEKTQEVSRIRLDKFTGGVMRRGLFSEAPISGTIRIKITVPAKYAAICGLMLYALRDLAMGLYNLGSGFAIGRGFLKVEKITAENGTQKLTLQRDGKAFSVCDPAGLADGWFAAIEGARDEN